MCKPTNLQFGSYQGLYDYFNKELFKNELSNCILNFSRKKQNNGGHFSPNRWTSKEHGVCHEINLNPKGYCFSDHKRLISVLVHEMAHCWQQDFGSPSRNGYHNKEWGAKMESIGLMPSNTGKPEGKRTGQQMTHYIIEGGLFDVAYERMPEGLYLPFKSFESPTVKKSSNKCKFSCPSCGDNAWGKPTLYIMCGGCELKMTLA